MTKFVEKSADELAKMTDEQKAAYLQESFVAKNEELKELIEKKASKEEIESLEKAIKELTENQIKHLSETISVQGIALKKLQSDEGKAPEPGQEFYKALEKALDSVSKMREGWVGVVNEKGEKIQLKTVGDMSISGSTSGQIPQAYRIPAYNTLLERRLTIRDVSSVFTTESNLVEWVYEGSEEGGAAVTSEGTTKTQSDRVWTVSSAKVFKITSYVKVTKEMLKFMSNIMANIQGRLTYLINRQEEDLLITGGGTTTLDGVTLHAQPLDNAGLSGSIPGTANYWDVIGAAYTQIQTETLGMANPNAVFMNPLDVFKMVYASKSSTYEYVAPVTVTPNGTMVNGIPVIETTAITAGNFLVGDFTKFNIYDAEGLTITMGHAGNDIIENRVSIVGEKMVASFVMQNDYNAFVYDAFADGVTFLSAGS